MTALLATNAGCKKKGAGDMAAKMKELAEKMCACGDRKCAEGVDADYRKWIAESAKSTGDKATAQTGEEAKAFTDASTAYANCTQKKMMGADAGSGSGSAAANAGSGSGSGDDAAGSGSQQATAPAVDGKLEGSHNAGNCPSMVLNSTTTAELKGNDIVVKVTSKDKDAIVAIQKRAEALIKEKGDGATGGAHDQKGSHGGQRGLCPVFLGEGGKATSKNDADGVAITITPKDKPDELKKQIDERITKAADWVKANIKDGDKGNQGGVGGGSGDHGANHSGKGDGKGKERKGDGKGDGKGGGAGTGGGGGAGTGGGGGSAKTGGTGGGGAKTGGGGAKTGGGW
ncbi:MAG: hypothetical protein KF773_26840 [Deltaproteobacteria bacterium]|nr:hypothetical protein [Deltaproteobacteria bacterium]